MHRAALDGAGADQRHLDHQVVEHPWFQSRQGGHLRAGLHLEDTNGVGALQHLVDSRLGQIEFGQIDLDTFVFGHQVDGVVQRRQHAQAEQVELHQTDCGAIIFVPLKHATVGHPGPFHRADVGDRAVADHHAARVDAHMPRQVLDLRR